MSEPRSHRVNGWRFSFAQFNSQELTRIAGIPGPLQRVWRSRGQLQGSAGPPPIFDAREVAENLVRYELSRLGVSPREADEEGCLGAQYMLWYALLNNDGACEVLGLPEHTSQFLTRFERDASIVAALTGQPRVRRYMIKLPDGEIRFISNLTAFLTERGPLALSILDLERAGNQLATKSGRPLMSVDVSPGSPGPHVRRLTGQRKAPSTKATNEAS